MWIAPARVGVDVLVQGSIRQGLAAESGNRLPLEAGLAHLGLGLVHFGNGLVLGSILGLSVALGMVWSSRMLAGVQHQLVSPRGTLAFLLSF